MVRDEEKYQLATHYRQQGFSYSEISKIVGVSKATLSAWFAKKTFSKKVKKDNIAKASRENVKRVTILNKARQNERDKVHKATIKQAEVEYKHYKTNPLFVAGLIFYASKGDCGQYNKIRVASSDAALHRVFHKFLIDFLGIEKTDIDFWLLLQTGQSEAVCTEVWSKTLKIKPEQFYKSQFIDNKNKKRLLHYGVGNTIICSTVLKAKLDRWIELSKKELAK